MNFLRWLAGRVSPLRAVGGHPCLVCPTNCHHRLTLRGIDSGNRSIPYVTTVPRLEQDQCHYKK